MQRTENELNGLLMKLLIGWGILGASAILLQIITVSLIYFNIGQGIVLLIMVAIQICVFIIAVVYFLKVLKEIKHPCPECDIKNVS